MFIFQFTQFKATEIKEDAIKKTPILAGGATQMEWKQLELSIRNESKNKGYDQKTTDIIVESAKKLWQSNDYDGLQKLLKTWELNETLKTVQNEISKQKTQKSGGKDKLQQQSATNVAQNTDENVNKRPTKDKIKGMGKKKALENLDQGKQIQEEGKKDSVQHAKVTPDGLEKQD